MQQVASLYYRQALSFYFETSASLKMFTMIKVNIRTTVSPDMLTILLLMSHFWSAMFLAVSRHAQALSLGD
jgi:hypothetical protein